MNSQTADKVMVRILGHESKQKDHWINANIKQRSTCKRYVANPGKKDTCECGRKHGYHEVVVAESLDVDVVLLADEIRKTLKPVENVDAEALSKAKADLETLQTKLGKTIKPQDTPEAILKEVNKLAKPWNRHNATDQEKTMAYGRIKFTKEDTDQTPEFVRLASDMCESDAGLEQVLNMMTLEEVWGMDEHKEPNLIISVTGGAKKFDVAPDLKKNFSDGLCKAAKSANAWVVTGGTDTGVMKMVGDAVYNHFGTITTIGIATWGVIMGKKQLMRKAGDRKPASATFDYDATKDKSGGSMAALNPHHTHFLLVDNGTDKKFGGEMVFRAKLEKKLCQYYPLDKTGTQKEIPIILVILNGGPNSATACLEAVKEDIPLLVIKGSGNSADVIARAHNCSIIRGGRRVLTPDGKKLVEEEMDNQFKDLPRSQKEEILSTITEILNFDRLVTIYSLDNKDLDHALLYALVKSKQDNNAAIEQMTMAIKWNRPKLALEILDQKVQFPHEHVQSCLKNAIIYDRKDFIDIFLNKVVASAGTTLEMKSFLTYRTLQDLYRSKPEDMTHLGKKRFFKVFSRLVPNVKREDITMVNIGQLLVKVLEGGFKNPFNKDCNLDAPIDNPFDMLVIYAALNDCKEMAEEQWSECHSPIATALIVYRIYKFHAEYTTGLTAYDHEAEEACCKEAAKYEDFACKSLSKCHVLFDKDDSFLLLSTPHDFWGGHDLLRIGMMVGSNKFLSHGAVQNFLTDEWMGRIKSSEPYIKILLCANPFLPLALKYEEATRTPEEIQHLLAEEKRLADRTRHNGMAIASLGGRLRGRGRNKIVMLNDCEQAGDTVPMKKMDVKKARDSLENKRKYELSWYMKYYSCFSSPIVKFFWNLIFFLLFLGLYAYILIAKHSDICALSEGVGINATEIYLLLYVIGTLPTEILQLVRNPAQRPLQKVWNHFSSFFNCVDGLAIFTYFFSFVIRVTTSTVPRDSGSSLSCEHVLKDLPILPSDDFSFYNLGHIINILSFMLYVVRLMDYFKISAEMGPKVIMIFRMVVDLFFFILLLLLFVFAYSVGSQAILRPNKSAVPNNANYFVDLIIYRPYLMAMGEFGIEEFIEDFKIDHCCSEDNMQSVSSMNFVNGTCNGALSMSCDADDFTISYLLSESSIAAAHYYVFIVMTIVYILIANILLVNLLIAIFSNTYERLQENSVELYLVQRAEMIVHFKSRSLLPNPFSIPEHVYMFLSYIYDHCCTTKRARIAGDPKFHKMTKIERMCCDEYIEHKDEELETYVKDTLKDLKQSMKELKTMLDNSNLGAAGMAAIADTDGDGEVDEGEVNNLRQALTAAIQQVSIGAPIEIHVDSRTPVYPDTDPKVERAPVPDEKVPWTVSWAEYKPVEYTKERSGDRSRHADDNKIDSKQAKTFNKNMGGIDRRSHLGIYDVDKETNRPRNPRGRTGISGKGALKRWGPNHQGDVVVTRWQTDEDGKHVLGADGRKVLEFVAIKKHEQWAIPGGRLVEGEKLVDTLEREFSEEALGSLEMSEADRKECMKQVERHFGLGIDVYKGYVDDPHNTDNAWYETNAINYHDADGSSFGNFPLANIGDEPDRARWITVDKNIDLYANHEWIIERVCFHRNAFCPIVHEDVEPEAQDGRFKLGAKKSSRWALLTKQASELAITEKN